MQLVHALLLPSPTVPSLPKLNYVPTAVAHTSQKSDEKCHGDEATHAFEASMAAEKKVDPSTGEAYTLKAWSCGRIRFTRREGMRAVCVQPCALAHGDVELRCRVRRDAR